MICHAIKRNFPLRHAASLSSGFRTACCCSSSSSLASCAGHDKFGLRVCDDGMMGAPNPHTRACTTKREGEEREMGETENREPCNYAMRCTQKRSQSKFANTTRISGGEKRREREKKRD